MTSWAVTLEQTEHSRSTGLVLYESIETGLRLTMSIEAFNNAGKPATVTVLVPEDELTDAAKSSHDAEPVEGDT
jgi:hypothetical protein